MDGGWFNNSQDSSSQVTWRETLSQFQLGFYTKAGTLRWEYFEDQRKNKVLEMSITDVIGSMDVRVRRKPALKFNNYRGTSSALWYFAQSFKERLSHRKFYFFLKLGDDLDLD